MSSIRASNQKLADFECLDCVLIFKLSVVFIKIIDGFYSFCNIRSLISCL